MARSRVHRPLRYRRARSVLFAIGLFWVWLWGGSGALLDGLHHSPVHLALAVYALAVAIIVSIPAALLAGIRMLLTYPPGGAVVVPLPAARRSQPGDAHWWYDEKAS